MELGAAARNGPAVEQAEVLYLLLQALHDSPFAALGATLAEQAAAQGLLPRRRDVHGTQHALSFQELQQRYAHLPHNALSQLLSQLLERRRAEAPQPAARGLTSLLEAGALSVLDAGSSTAGTSGAVVGAALQPPVWLRRGWALLSEPHRLLLLRQAGLLRSAQHPCVVQPPEVYARNLAHALTVRGHRYAVYCVTFDRIGGYLVTGSDDRLVKIWSTRTGLLQASCRGHDAEITDLSVSADNSLVASSSMDGTVRVWQLEGKQGKQGRPGLPVSVLVGHEGPAAFLDFHPTHPDALLSASFDGTLRIWRARDASVPPMVLRVDPARFGLSGHAVTRLGNLGWPGFAASAAAAGGALELDLGVRTTRNMERQLLGLLGSGTAGAAGNQQEQSARQGGRPARQQRNLSDLLDGADEDGEAGGEGGGGAAAEGEGGQDGTGAAGSTTGLLVCGFSKDGSHIVAGGNDCSVYVWQWEVPLPALAGDLQAPVAGTPGNTPAGMPGLGTAGGTAGGTAASPCTSPGPRQQQQTNAAAGAAAGAADAAAVPAPAGQPAAEAQVAAADGGPGGSVQQGAASEPPPAATEERPQEVQQPPGPSQQQQAQHRQPRRRGARSAAATAGPAEDAPWPVPREVCQLKGHRNDIILLQFSHSGDLVATGSKDGSVRVWRRPRRWRKRPQAWEQEVTFAVLPDPEAIKEARRRRRPPPAPSVDQIAWSADDQRLCVSITDYGIRVLAMPSGQLLLNLNIHTNHVHILECHPTDPAIAFSASYDGTLAVWDTRSGTVLRRFSSRQTRPDGRSWPDLIPFSDGHFSPDGRSITVTDVAGQLHNFALGPPCSLLSRAPYDQFLTTDYSPLLRDLQHNVLDAETQLPPHVLTGREALCDALGNPYPEALQAAYRAQRMLSAPPQEVAWLEPGKEPGYLLAAPTLTAAAWAVEQINGTEHATQLAIARAQERLTVHEDRLDAGATAAAAREAAHEAGRPRSRQRGAAWAAAVEEGPGGADEMAEPASSGEMYTDSRAGADSDEDVDSALFSSEEDEDEFDEAAGGGAGGRRGRRGAAVEASRHSSRLARRQAAGRSGRTAGGSGRAASSRPGTRRSRPAPAAEVGQASGEDHEQREEQQRADREARAARRRAAQQEQLAEARHQRQRQAAARRRPSAVADTSDEDEEISEATSDGGEAGPSQHPTAQRTGTSRRRGRAETEERQQQEEAGRQSKRSRRGGGRELVNYGWLLDSQQTPGVYVPQAGDDVVYLREGHEAYLASTNDKRPPPWHTLRHGRSMRPAEPCRVVDLRYVIADNGTDHTLVQLTLSLSDEASELKDTCFTVEVHPPFAGHVEFVIHRSRFEASVVGKCWEVGDQCQTYWNDDEDTGAGTWWVGTIVADHRAGRNADVLADKFGAGGLWDRFEVQWQGVVGPDGEVTDKAADNSMHCPWELYTPGTTHQAALQEAPSMDAALAQRMLVAVEAASQQDRFVLFVAAPEHDEIYVSRNRRSQYYNRLVALPLSLTQLSTRLCHNYYRQPAALANDIATIACNAITFNGEDSEIPEDAAVLARYLTLVLHGEEPDLAEYATYPEDEVVGAAEAADEAGGSSRRPRRQRKPRRQAGDLEEEWDEVKQEEMEEVKQEVKLEINQGVKLEVKQQGFDQLMLGVPLLQSLAGLPPIPPSELPPMPVPQQHLTQQQQQQQKQQQQQQQQQQGEGAAQQQQQQGVQPWLSGLPSSFAPPGASVTAGFVGTGAGRAGALRVRLPASFGHLRAAAAETAPAGDSSAEAGAGAGAGTGPAADAGPAAAAAAGAGLAATTAGPAAAEAVPATAGAGTSPAAAAAAAGAGPAVGAEAAGEGSRGQAVAPIVPAAGEAGAAPGSAAASEQARGPAAVPPAVPASLFQDVAAAIVAGSGLVAQTPDLAAAVAGAAAAGPSAAAGPAAAAAAGQAAAAAAGQAASSVHMPLGPPAAWFAEPAGAGAAAADGAAPPATGPPASWFAAPAPGAQLNGLSGQQQPAAAGAGGQWQLPPQAQQQQQEVHDSGRRYGVRSSGGGRMRRTTGRTRQQFSYRESDGEEEEEAAGGRGKRALREPTPRQGQRQRPPRQQKKQDSDEDWMEEDAGEAEESGSDAMYDGAESSDSGDFGSTRRQRASGRRGGRQR